MLANIVLLCCACPVERSSVKEYEMETTTSCFFFCEARGEKVVAVFKERHTFYARTAVCLLGGGGLSNVFFVFEQIVRWDPYRQVGRGGGLKVSCLVLSFVFLPPARVDMFLYVEHDRLKFVDGVEGGGISRYLCTSAANTA